MDHASILMRISYSTKEICAEIVAREKYSVFHSVKTFDFYPNCLEQIVTLIIVF